MARPYACSVLQTLLFFTRNVVAGIGFTSPASGVTSTNIGHVDLLSWVDASSPFIKLHCIWVLFFLVVHNHLRGTATVKKVLFREHYGKIGERRCFLPTALFVAMTATAGKKTEDIICDNLQIWDHESIRMSCDRTNIWFVISMPYITRTCLWRNFVMSYCTHVGRLLYWFSTTVFHKMLSSKHQMNDRLNSVLGSKSDNIRRLLSW